MMEQGRIPDQNETTAEGREVGGMQGADERMDGTAHEPAEPGNSASGTGPDRPRPSKAGGELVEWIKALAVAGLLVFVIRWFLVSPFIVDGPSMQPNFLNHERIIVNKIIYDIRQPKRGEVIVFHVPDQGRDFIKRVIGVPGDTVKVEGDSIFINGKKIEEAYLKKEYEAKHAVNQQYNCQDAACNFPNGSFPEGKVPEGALFVMGDNRPDSQDSRAIGFIPLDRVVGRADMVYWPLPDFHFVSHG